MKQALVALLLVTALAGARVSAQTSPTSVSGVVVSSTTDSLVVRLDDGTQRTFAVETTTTLPSGRLAEGNHITIRYRPLSGGLYRAENVMMVEAPVAGTDGSAATAPSSATTATTDRDSNLPATASPLPLLALVGSGALLTALALSATRRNS